MEEESHYAPALRTTAEKILKEYELVGSQKFFTEIFGRNDRNWSSHR